MATDCHVHLERIGPPHKSPPPTPDELKAYVRDEGIEMVAGIYETDTTLDAFADSGARIVPFYWERTPQRPRIPPTARGIKLHPFIERYVLSADAVGPVFEIARSRSLPILVHTDDRTPELSRGSLAAALAMEFPTVRIILAHAGAYAPPRLDMHGTSWTDAQVIVELVTEAIAAATRCPNVYLETSVLASRTKAELLARRAPLQKLLIGSDFPIYRDRVGRISFQEAALRDAGMNTRAIAQLHQNALDVLRYP